MRKVLTDSLTLVPAAIPWDATLRYVVAVGVPLTLLVAFGHTGFGVIAALGAMFASTRDPGGRVRDRIAIMVLTVVFTAAGAAFGVAIGHTLWATVVGVFVTATAAGWLHQTHPGIETSGRFAVLGMVVGTGLDALGLADPRLALALIAGGVFAALVLAVDALVRGAGSYTKIPPWSEGWRQLLSGNLAIVRFAGCYGLTAALSLLVATEIGAERAYWVAATTLLVMSPDALASWQRVIQRFVGTMVGILVAWGIVDMFHTPWALVAATMVLAVCVKPGSARNYWVGVAMMCAMIMVLLDLALLALGGDRHLLEVRLYDTMIGCAFAAAGTELWRVAEQWWAVRQSGEEMKG